MLIKSLLIFGVALLGFNAVFSLPVRGETEGRLYISEETHRQFTEEMKESLIPDSIISFGKSLSKEHIKTLTDLYKKFRDESGKMNQAKSVDFVMALRTKHPDVFALIIPLAQEIYVKIGAMNMEAQQFFRNSYGEGMTHLGSTGSDDTKFAKFFCHIYYKWSEMSVEGKESFANVYPKIVASLNNPQIHRAANCQT